MARKEETFGFNVGDRLAAMAAAGDPDYEYRIVDVGSIDHHPDNRSINAEAVEEMAQSLLADGLGQLPLVRVSPDDPGRLQMIAGHHRLLAFKANYERTGDGKWLKMPVVVKKGCDDRAAERLLWATNIHNAELSPAERGHGFEVLGMDVPRMREEDPERYAGRRTNEIIAEIASDGEHSVSETTVKRARRAYRESLAPAAEPERKEDGDRARAERALAALDRAVGTIEKLDDQGVPLSRDALRRCRARLWDVMRKRGEEQ